MKKSINLKTTSFKEWLRNLRIIAAYIFVGATIFALFALCLTGCGTIFQATTTLRQEGEKSTLVISPTEIEYELEDPRYKLNDWEYKIDVVYLYLSDRFNQPDYKLLMEAGGDALVDVSHLPPGRYFYNARVNGEKFDSLDDEIGIRFSCVIDSLSFEIW